MCAACGSVLEPGGKPSRGVFLIILLLLVAGFALTGIVVRGHKARQQQLAQRWFSRGDRDLSRGAPSQAVDDFQTALAYAPQNDAFRLKLALALMQSGEEDEARVHLINLWEARPGDANINLQLARVMARLGHSQDAIRYYQGAIYGVWDSDPLEKREQSRFELARYLLASRQTNAAESELIALASESPSSPANELRLGDLFMETGDSSRALSAYLHARSGPQSARANLSAAEASFSLHRFREAREYARDALRADPALEDASVLEKQVEEILKADPQAQGLNARQQAERTYSAYKSAYERLQDCTDATEDSSLQELKSAQEAQFKRLNTTALMRDPDLRANAVQWVYDVEKAAEGSCGAPSGLDATLLMLARFQGAR